MTGKRIDVGLRSTAARCVTTRKWCANGLGRRSFSRWSRRMPTDMAWSGFRRRSQTMRSCSGWRIWRKRMALRKALPHPIIILGPAIPEERSAIVEGGFIPTISTFEEAQEFSRSAGESSRSRSISRSTREWDAWECRKSEAARLLFKKVVGIAEHENPQRFNASARVERRRGIHTRGASAICGKLSRQLRAEIPGDYKAHVLQSAGTLAFADPPFDIVRAGIMLYGISPLPEFQKILKTGHDLENADRTCPRHAEGQFDQLWPDIYHAATRCGSRR